MFAGLPWNSWLLLIAAVSTGLTIELLYYRRETRRHRGRGTRTDEGS